MKTFKCKTIKKQKIMEIQGKVIAILEPQRFVSQKNGNEYVTTVFILETAGQYPKKIAFKVMGEDKFKQMGITVGGAYNISFDVESREWQGKWFTECQAWKVVRIDAQQQQKATGASAPSPTSTPAAKPQRETTSTNDLPF